MSRTKKLLSNTVIFGVGQFASKLMVYFLMPLYTAYLSASESSVADFIQQTGNLLMPIAAIGIYDGLLRFAMDAGERRREYFSNSMAVLCAGSLIFIVLSPVIRIIDASGTLFGGLWWLVPLFVLTANMQIAVSYYVRSLGYTKIYAAQGIINTALTVLFNLLFLVVLDMNIAGFVLAVVFSNLIVTFILIIWLRLWRDMDVKLIKKETVREMLKYSIPLIPTTLLWTLTSLTDRFLVRIYCSEEMNGLFVYAYKIPTVLTLVTTIFIEAWQLSAVNDADDSDRGGFFTTVFRNYMGLIFMAASALIAFSKIFAAVLLNESYFGAWEYMPTLIVATVFSAFSTFTATVYMVKKKSVISFVTALTGASVNILLSWIFVGFMGVQGVALATIISYAVLFAYRLLTAKKYIDFSINLANLAINTLLISAQAVLMILQPAGWIIIQAAFMCAVLVFNGKPIINAVLMVLRRRKNSAG